MQEIRKARVGRSFENCETRTKSCNQLFCGQEVMRTLKDTGDMVKSGIIEDKSSGLVLNYMNSFSS